MTKKLRKLRKRPSAGNIVVRAINGIVSDPFHLYVVCEPALQDILHHHYKWSNGPLHTISLKTGASYSGPAREWKVVHGFFRVTSR